MTRETDYVSMTRKQVKDALNAKKMSIDGLFEWLTMHTEEFEKKEREVQPNLDPTVNQTRY